MSEIVKAEKTAIEAAKEFAELTGQFTADQILSMRRSGIIPPQAQGYDLKQFLYACAEMGANPILKQMYLLSRNGKKKDANGRDVLKNGSPVYEAKFYYVVDYKFLMAKCDETGQWGGHSAITFNDGMTIDECVKNDIKKPRSARVTVTRIYPNGATATATGEASFEEYGSNSPNWRGSPFTMLGKVAMRKACTGAFPAATQGMYLAEEFDGAAAGAVEVTTESGQSVDIIPDTAFYSLESATTIEELDEVEKAHAAYNNRADWVEAVTRKREELEGGAE